MIRVAARAVHLLEDDLLELGQPVLRDDARRPAVAIDAMSASAIDATAMTLLLVDADDVVVGRGAEDDVAARLVDVGGLVDDDRRVARAGADRALAAGHRRLDDRAAAGDDEQADAAFVRISSCADSMVGSATQVMTFGGPPAAMIALLSSATVCIEQFLARRVDVEDDACCRPRACRWRCR